MIGINWFKRNKPDKKELRDEFAMNILPRIMKDGEHKYRGCENILDDDCRFAYKIADIMIRIRKSGY